MIQQQYSDGKQHIHVLSYGGGTQSTAMLLKALKGDFNGVVPDFIIFSDTGFEGETTYNFIDKINNHIKKNHGKEIIFTSRGNIYEDTINGVKNNTRFPSMPIFMDNEGKKGIIRRQCTSEYKIKPVNRKIRDLLGYKPRQRIKEHIHVWKGISNDEITRMKPSPFRWSTFEYPLVEVADMSRDDCIQYVEQEGLGTPPKSACLCCPFRRTHQWLDMKENQKQDWEKVVAVDNAIRHCMPKGIGYLSDKRIPLTELEMVPDDGTNHFENECEGMCGV